MEQENKIWSGTPSQVINLGDFIGFGLFFWLIFPLFVILWKYLIVKNTKYKLTNQRLKTSHGVFNKKIDELELYRVKDYKIDQPFFLRMFSLGNIILETSDKSHSTISIKAVSNPDRLREEIRTHVEECRDKKHVREVDFQ